MRVLAATVADPAANGFRRFNARVVGGLPLPGQVLHDPDLLELAESARCGRLNQGALDERCARLLNLDADTCGRLSELAQAGRDRR
jgi:hypothetical protein